MPAAFTELSQAVSHKMPKELGDYIVVSLPKGMEIIDNQFVLSEKIPTIAIIDNFDGKIRPELKLSHGDIVTKYAVHGLEKNFGVLAFNVGLEGHRPYTIIEALKAVREIQRAHQNIIALNMSISTSITYEELTDRYAEGKYYSTGKDTGLAFAEGTGTISPRNVVRKREKLQALLKAETSEATVTDLHYTLLSEIVQGLNELVDLGIEVYLSAGNERDECFNIFTLSNAQHIVSSHDTWSSNRVFSTEQASGDRWLEKIYDEQGNLLCILDGNIVISAEEAESHIQKRVKELFFWYPPNTPIHLKGTSFASPIKMNHDLKIKFRQVLDIDSDIIII